ncbi:MAG: DNA recombination protein RmuC [Muribaculaceae bacterium]|nr:DNA recombination protein RmuC [Muribaculaceae bacterium]
MNIVLPIILFSALAAAVVYIIYLVRNGAEGRKADSDTILSLRDQLSRSEEKSASLTERLQEAHESNRQITERLNDSQTLLQESVAKAERLQERLTLMESERERIDRENEQRFKLLAQQIMEANAGKFNEESRRSLADVLAPLKTDIDRFKQQVETAYNTEARERFALSERIKELVELNMTIGREAKELTRALRGDSKVQGDWGELVLETLLEKSGLVKGVHFDLQLTTDADGNVIRDSAGRMLRPDAVIYYPDGRSVIVDSKVSLTAYIDFINAEHGSADAQAALQSHLRSVRSHINELATKNYQDFIGDRKADFVTMFIPNEGGYLAAMQADSKLWQDAYDRRVLIVSPTHLLSVLKLVEQMWRQDDMKRNVIEIAEESGKMYDKFVGFVDDMAKIDKSLTQAGAAFADAMNKLSEGKGNLVRRAEKLRSMGAKTNKRLSSALVDKALPDTDSTDGE